MAVDTHLHPPLDQREHRHKHGGQHGGAAPSVGPGSHNNPGDPAAGCLGGAQVAAVPEQQEESLGDGMGAMGAMMDES